MPKPTFDFDEIKTHYGIQQHATLTVSQFKAFILVMNDFIEEFAEQCSPRFRSWADPRWRRLAAKFIQMYGKNIWARWRPGVKRENVQPAPNEETATAQAERTGSEGGIPLEWEAHEQLAAHAVGDDHNNYPVEDMLVYPDDLDAIAYLVFCMMKIESAKHFSSTKKRQKEGKGAKKKGPAKGKRSIRKGKSIDEESATDDEELTTPTPTPPRKRKRKKNPEVQLARPWAGGMKREVVVAPGADAKKFKGSKGSRKQPSGRLSKSKAMHQLGDGFGNEEVQDKSTPSKGSTEKNPYFLDGEDADEKDDDDRFPRMEIFRPVHEDDRYDAKEERVGKSRVPKFPSLTYQIPSLTDDAKPTINPRPRKALVRTPKTSKTKVSSTVSNGSEGGSQSIPQLDGAEETADPVTPSPLSEDTRLLQKFKARKERNSPSLHVKGPGPIDSPQTQALKSVDFVFRVHIGALPAENPTSELQVTDETIEVAPPISNSFLEFYNFIFETVEPAEQERLEGAAHAVVDVFQMDGSRRQVDFAITGREQDVDDCWWECLDEVFKGAKAMREAGLKHPNVRWEDNGDVELVVDLRFE